jgi:hypothetical protein
VTTRIIPPIEQAVVVRCSVGHAFDVFTARLGDWWPIETHSVAAGTERRAVAAAIEGRVGGRVYETQDDGTECTWGTVTAWEPPLRLVILWTVSDEGADTEIEVRFEPVEDGTRVTLVHRGWDTRQRRSSYETGWPAVLDAFAKAAGSTSP